MRALNLNMLNVYIRDNLKQFVGLTGSFLLLISYGLEYITAFGEISIPPC